MGQNETERHFELRNLEKDMAEAARKGPPILSKQQAAELRFGGWLALCIVIALVALLYYLLGGF
jgi:hypothetical protein